MGKRTFFWIFIVMVAPVLFLSGCTKEKIVEFHPLSKHDTEILKQTIPYSFLGKDYVVPISPEVGSFYSVSGWLNDRKIIYITETSRSANIYVYDLQTGKSKLFHESSNPIVSIEISPSKKYILVHSSPSTYEGLITVFNIEGKEVASKEIQSNELAFQWNSFKENLILISAFTEEWEYSLYEFNLLEQTLHDIKLPNPFAYWLNNKEVVYLGWDESNPSFFASLMKHDLVNQTSREILPSVYQLASVGRHLLTITVDENNLKEAQYTIYSDTFKQLKTFVIPHLTRFSDWLVPFYDFNESLGRFLTFKPLYSSEVDTYAEGFDLVSYHLDSEEHEVLFSGLVNEPISCSPSGVLCLYGYYFEKLIDLKSKEIISIVE
ncbi:hypothetical protein ACFYKX_17930 [Cytobacillus sp. FJAT-54145]|uniref:YqgU-like 6-bladed beta-propeller domain-containing protein n=1 Tax=Cytobacillus spartinae TaxID=3299023 RepID=A0ABW6KHY7_9BACI